MNKILIDAIFLDNGKAIEGKVMFEKGFFFSEGISHTVKQRDIGTVLFLNQKYKNEDKK